MAGSIVALTLANVIERYAPKYKAKAKCFTKFSYKSSLKNVFYCNIYKTIVLIFLMCQRIYSLDLVDYILHAIAGSIDLAEQN